MNFSKRIVETSEVSYDKSGKKTENTSQKVFAKSLATNEDGRNKTSYFIATYNNAPYNIFGPESHRENTLNIALKKVSKNTFDYYIKFLQTNNSLYITRANRSFLNV